jgi:hypothetical protein
MLAGIQIPIPDSNKMIMIDDIFGAKSSASYVCQSSSWQREFQNAPEGAGFEVRLHWFRWVDVIFPPFPAVVYISLWLR